MIVRFSSLLFLHFKALNVKGTIGIEKDSNDIECSIFTKLINRVVDRQIGDISDIFQNTMLQNGEMNYRKRCN